jgi:hypothetical protein
MEWNNETIERCANALVNDWDLCGNLTVSKWAMDNDLPLPDDTTCAYIHTRKITIWQESLKGMEEIS